MQPRGPAWAGPSMRPQVGSGFRGPQRPCPLAVCGALFFAHHLSSLSSNLKGQTPKLPPQVKSWI